MAKYRVVIVQRILTHYRLYFFEYLSSLCKNKNIELVLIHGNEKEGDVPKGQGATVSGIKNIYINNFYFSIGKFSFVWQPALKHILKIKADLIIVENANRLVINYLLLFLKKIGLVKKLSYWGHVKNYQGDNGLAEKFKKILIHQVDYFFFYTKHESQNSKSIDNKIGINNAIDTRELQKNIRSFINSGIKKRKYGLVFCGSMRTDKEIPFLLDTLKKVKVHIPELTCEFVGSGPVQHIVEEFCDVNKWSTFHGFKTGYEKDLILWRNTGLVIPGLVGLIILDSFYCQTPLLTTTYDFKHSPEIAYLENGNNGLMSEFSENDYVSMVVNFLENETLQKKLVTGCKESSKQYSVEQMAKNFHIGINEALGMNKL